MFARFREKTPIQQMLEVGMITIGVGLAIFGVVFIIRGQLRPPSQQDAATVRGINNRRKEALTERSRRDELCWFFVKELGYTHDQDTFDDALTYDATFERKPNITDDGLRATWTLGSLVDGYKGNLKMWGDPGQSRRRIIDAMKYEFTMAHFSYPRSFLDAGKLVLEEAESIKPPAHNPHNPAISERREIGEYCWQVVVVDERPVPRDITYSEYLKYKPEGPVLWRISLHWWSLRELEKYKSPPTANVKPG